MADAGQHDHAREDGREDGIRHWQGRRYWLVGASEGLGRALAEVMSRNGVELVLSARNAARLDDLVATLPGRARAVPADVTDSASVRAAAAQAGPLDGMVWLAGVWWPMHARDWDADRIETMFDTNLTGAARAIGAVLPDMVQRGAGHIVLTGSLAGMRGIPRAAGYAAAKAGLYSLAETMQLDLKGTGVDVQIVNPGFIRTRMVEGLDIPKPGMIEPEDAARRMFEFMGTDRFSGSFPLGLSIAARSAPFLPYWLYRRIVG